MKKNKIVKNVRMIEITHGDYDNVEIKKFIDNYVINGGEEDVGNEVEKCQCKKCESFLDKLMFDIEGKTGLVGDKRTGGEKGKKKIEK